MTELSAHVATIETAVSANSLELGVATLGV